jgi:hypothetical protein
LTARWSDFDRQFAPVKIGDTHKQIKALGAKGIVGIKLKNDIRGESDDHS